MKTKRLWPYISCVLLIGLFISLGTAQGDTGSAIRMWKSQTIYVPIYSHVYLVGDERIPLNLAVNLVIRNTDFDNKITIASVKYYDSEGKLLKEFLTQPKQLSPMGSTYFLIKASDNTGGWGANFVVKWQSTQKVTEPIVEAVFTGARGSHSFSFNSRGKAIRGN